MATPSVRPPTQWPPNAKPFYRPTLIAAIGACVAVVIGSIGPWATVLLFTINGLDTSWWGFTTLTAGVLAAGALVLLLVWSRTAIAPRWSVPTAWLAAVLAVCCVSMSLPFLIRILTSPRVAFFGVTIGPGVGWGLWLLTVSSLILTVCAIVVAVQIGSAVELFSPLGQSPNTWTQTWMWTAIAAAAVIVLASSIHFALNWEFQPGDSLHEPTPTMPSFTMPSFPDFTTTPTP